jgi:hypothetical protein
MKYLMASLAFFLFNLSYSQIEISDNSKQTKVVGKPYNGEFAVFDYSLSEEQKAGVVGSKITLIDVFIYNIKTKDGKTVSGLGKDLFSNKTFDIIDYSYDFHDELTIQNDTGIYIYNPSLTDTYLFNSFFDNIKSKYSVEQVLTLRSGKSLKNVEGVDVSFIIDKPYEITDIRFSKLANGYGFTMTLNNENTFVYPTNYNQTKEPDFLKLSSNEILPQTVLFILKSKYNQFEIENKRFISEIKEGVAKAGMTEKQVVLSWGTPSKVFSNIAGYDKVYDYGTTGNSQTLYFKKGILKLIK